MPDKIERGKIFKNFGQEVAAFLPKNHSFIATSKQGVLLAYGDSVDHTNPYFRQVLEFNLIGALQCNEMAIKVKKDEQGMITCEQYDRSFLSK